MLDYYIEVQATIVGMQLLLQRLYRSMCAQARLHPLTYIRHLVHTYN